MKTYEVLLVPTPAAPPAAGTPAATYNLLPNKLEPDLVRVRATDSTVTTLGSLCLYLAGADDSDDPGDTVAIFAAGRWIACLAVPEEEP